MRQSFPIHRESDLNKYYSFNPRQNHSPAAKAPCFQQRLPSASLAPVPPRYASLPSAERPGGQARMKDTPLANFVKKSSAKSVKSV
jgi:hypothetical protein